jgi:hypothetical protein
MSAADHRQIDLGLTTLAFLYANGELEGADAEAFEKRLCTDQEAREALSQAVLLTQTVDGCEAPRPDPGYRDRVRQQLLPNLPPAGWRAVLRPQVYRGHPAVWLLTGALAGSLLLFFITSKKPADPSPRRAVVNEPQANLPPPRPRLPQFRPTRPAPAPTKGAMAEVWAELHTCSHLERVRAEEARRKQRLEVRRSAHNDDRADREENDN